MQFTSAIVLICAAATVQAHGFLRSPTARGGNSAGPSSAICGKGGTGAGNIRATYVQGQTIEVEWETTIAHNNGFVEMRVCDKQQVSNGCLNENLLRRADNGQTRVNNVNGKQRFSVEYRLPADLTCPNGCVMQWFWDTPNNGEYHGCTDIRINPMNVGVPDNGNNGNNNQDIVEDENDEDEEDEEEDGQPQKSGNNPLEMVCSERVSENSCRERNRQLVGNRACCRFSNKCPGYASSKCLANSCCE